MRLAFIFFIFLIGFTFATRAQTDLHLKALGALKSSFSIRDSSMLNDLNQTAKDSMFRNTDKSEIYARIAFKIGKKIEYPRGVIESLINLSTAKLYGNEFDSAMVFANQSVARSKRLPEGKLLVKSYGAKGKVYHAQGKYSEAISYHLKAVTIAERSSPTIAAPSYVNIGLAFRLTGNKVKALAYQQKAIKAARRYNDSISLSGALNNLGVLAKEDKDYQEALVYYNEGLAVATAIDLSKVMANIANNISNVYFQLGNSDLGMEYFEISLEESKNMKSYSGIAIQYHNLSYNLYDLGRLNESREASEQARLYADSAHNFQLLVETNAMCANIYYDLGVIMPMLMDFSPTLMATKTA